MSEFGQHADVGMAERASAQKAELQIDNIMLATLFMGRHYKDD